MTTGKSARGQQLSIIMIGLSITSSWGNGHATTYRGLMRELTRRGHDVLFLERDVPWYAANRDLADPPYGRTSLYNSVEELQDRFTSALREADFVVVGSYVPEGAAIGEWVVTEAGGATAFYDIDTPVTLAKLARGECEYLTTELIRRYDLYLSFTGGPVLERLERHYRAQASRALYCSIDPEIYHPQPAQSQWDLGYMGTYSEDRQSKLDVLLCTPARRWQHGRFVVAGPQYPASITWPGNVERVEHLAPPQHRRFYAAQRFTLNLTRADMTRCGWSPSVRLFEAAACATPIISDAWPGLEAFFVPGREILVAREADACLDIVRALAEADRMRIGHLARERVLRSHTAAHRAAEFDIYIRETLCRRAAA